VADDRQDFPPLPPWFRSPLGQFAAALAAVGLFACYWFFQVAPLISDVYRGQHTGIVGFASHQADYKHLYLGSKLLGAGLSPYDDAAMIATAGEYSQTVDVRFRGILPYVYLPFTGLVMTPLTALPFAWSAVAFQFVNHLAILGGLLIAGAACRWRHDFWSVAILVAMAAFNGTVWRQNDAGQLNAILFLGMAVLYLALVRGWHDSLIGFVAAFLAMFKLTPGIFLIWFLLRGEYRRAAWMAGMMAGMVAIGVGTFGLDRHLEFLPVLRDMGYGRSTWAEHGQTFFRDTFNQSFNALFHRQLGGSPTLANGLTWVASLSILGLFAWHGIRRRGAPLGASFSAAVAVSLLVPSILWDHYLVQLLLPIVILATTARGWRLWSLVACAALVSVWIPFDDMAPNSVLQNAKLLPVLWVFGMAVWSGASREE